VSEMCVDSPGRKKARHGKKPTRLERHLWVNQEAVAAIL
jgi:hypothetical protein